MTIFAPATVEFTAATRTHIFHVSFHAHTCLFLNQYVASLRETRRELKEPHTYALSPQIIINNIKNNFWGAKCIFYLQG
ncbi:hypothetical protein ACJX0J_014912, partial [Zea mays]